MFEELIGEFDRLKRTGIAIPLAVDERGFLDRQCPSEACRACFKVHEDDWEGLKSRSDAAHCPRCGTTSPDADTWTTESQLEHARHQATRLIEDRLHRAVEREALAFNSRQQKGTFLSLAMSVKPTPFYFGGVLPAPAASALEMDVQCAGCSTRYSVLGCAFFCPGCGLDSVERLFDVSLNRVESALAATAAWLAAADGSARSDATTVMQFFMENSLREVVSAFEHLSSEQYARIASGAPARGNVFQRLADASQLWRSAVGSGYEDWLSHTQERELRRLVQVRHVLTHNAGLVDQRYLDRSGDHRYQLGERVVVDVADLRTLLSLVRLLANEMRQRVLVSLSPPASQL